MQQEREQLAAFLKAAIAYGRGKGFTGDFFIEPKPGEPTTHQYDYDSATVIGFLREFDLMNDLKLNIEANHCTLAGHTFEHDLQVAAGGWASWVALMRIMVLFWVGILMNIQLIWPAMCKHYWSF